MLACPNRSNIRIRATDIEPLYGIGDKQLDAVLGNWKDTIRTRRYDYSRQSGISVGTLITEAEQIVETFKTKRDEAHEY